MEASSEKLQEAASLAKVPYLRQCEREREIMFWASGEAGR